MFRNLLVPLDFSDRSLAALRLARGLAKTAGGRIHLLHVAEEEAEFAVHSSADLVSFFRDIEVKRDRWLRELMNELDGEGLAGTVAIRKGAASDAILAHVSEIGADLVVLSTVGLDPLSRLFEGSTTKRVVRACPVPVCTLSRHHASWQTFRISRVLVPTDFSPGSDDAVAFATTLADALHAEVRLLHVIKLPSYIPVLPGEPPLEIPPHAVESIRERSVEQLRQAVAHLPEDRFAYDVTTGSDHADAIAAYAREQACDLIVTARVGQNVLQSLLYGRTAEAIVGTSPVPVISLPPQRHTGRAPNE